MGAVVAEAAALFVVFVVARVERMDVAQHVAAATDDDARENVCDAHVRQRVVAAVHNDTDGIRLAVADDVDVRDVRVGRAVVCASSDVEADARVLDVDLFDDGFAAAVDGDAVRHVAAVDDAARDGIQVADGTDVVGGMDAAEADDWFAFWPAVNFRLQNGVVGELKIDAFRGLRRRAKRFGEEINTVWEEEGAVRIGGDESLEGVGNVCLAVGLDGIRDDDISFSFRH